MLNVQTVVRKHTRHVRKCKNISIWYGHGNLRIAINFVLLTNLEYFGIPPVCYTHTNVWKDNVNTSKKRDMKSKMKYLILFSLRRKLSADIFYILLTFPYRVTHRVTFLCDSRVTHSIVSHLHRHHHHHNNRTSESPRIVKQQS